MTSVKKEYMDKAMQTRFQRILEKLRQEIVEGGGRTVHRLQGDTTSFPDMVDRASLEEEFNLELRTRDRESKLLRKIDEALARLKEGIYGYCDKCGAEIGIKRLEARPTATQCIDCKTFDEIKEKQTEG